MATRQYIGARYVPKFYQNSVDGSAQWESNVVYEPLMYVTLTNGHMYLSRKQVPATVGSPVDNIDYWLDVANYNGYISELQAEIDDINNVKIPAVQSSIAFKQDATDNNLATSDKTVVGAINEVNSALTNKQDATDNNLATSDKTVVGAINEVNTALSNKQDKNDNSLATTDKTVVGAINEVNTFAGNINEKLNNLKVINVLDYGAKGDGTTDDTTAINNAAVAAEGNILYFPVGIYIVSDTIHIKNRTKVIGANCDSSIIRRATGMTGNTFECGYLDSNDGLGAGAVEIKDLRFIRDLGLNYAQVPNSISLPDTVDESDSHIAIYYGQNFIVDNCLIEGMPIGIDVTLSAVGRITNCNIGAGISTRNISEMTAIYQGQACIRLGHIMDGQSSGYTQLISIHDNRFFGATSANQLSKTVGSATETVNRSCGSSYGLLIECCEGLNFYSNYSGANNFANIGISATEIVMNIKIHDNFFDPSDFYCISLNNGSVDASEIEIVDNVFNGQLIGLMAISADALSLKNYNVHISDNIFDNFLGCMMYINSVKGVSISSNRISNYNCLNSNSDAFWGSGITVGDVAKKVYTHDNVFGGDVNTLADSTQCINGVYYATQDTDNYSVNEYALSISGTLVVNNGQ